MQSTGDSVGDFIHFLICICGINGHKCLLVGLCLGKVTDTLVEQFERRFTCGSLPYVAELLFLMLTDDR